MNPELQKAIADVLAVVKDGAQFAAAAGVQELPLLVQEYLTWALVSSLFEVAVGLIAAIAAVKAIRWAPSQRYDESHYNTYERGEMKESMIPVLIVAMCGGCLGVGAVLHGVCVAMQVWIAPRVYLLETLTRLVQ